MNNTIKITGIVTGCVLLLSILAYLFVFLIQSRTTITNVTPDITTDNATITIYGTHFGKERGTGSIQINNQLIPPSSYRLWSNSTVRIVLPQQFTSGIIELITHRGNVAVYIISHFDFIPIATSQSSGARMNIDTIAPQGALSIGDVLTIRGTFLNYEQIEIFLPHNVKNIDSDGVLVNSNDNNLLKVPEWSYIKKNSTEIELRIPTGATSGSIIVRDSFDSEWTGTIQIDDSVGSQQYYEPVVYNLLFQFDNPEPSNGAPLLYSLPSDPHGQSISSILFSSHTYRLLHLDEHWYYQLAPTEIANDSDIDDSANTAVRFALQTKRYTVSTIISNSAAINRQATISNHYFGYTRSNRYYLQSIDIPDVIPNFANRPYVQRIRDIYAYVLRALQADIQPVESSFLSSQSPADIILETVEDTLDAISKVDATETNAIVAGAFEYASLMFFLLNTNDIPTRLTVGLLFEDDATNSGVQQPISASIQSATSMRIVPHYWVSCYLPAIGWIPIDSALGDEMYVRDGIEEASEYYLGNLDNQRIIIQELSTLQNHNISMSALHLYQRVQPISTLDSAGTIVPDDKSYGTHIALFSQYE